MALLEVAGITVQFGGVTAVNDASLSVEAGAVTGLIGPNGAGKTTLFNVISGLQPPTKGRIRFGSQDITKTQVNSRAKMGIGRTFQRLEAFGSLSVRENVLVAREIHDGPRSWLRRKPDRIVDELIDRVGLRSYADARADSVPTGVARLLEMARALATEPRLLLLDEPSSGLDEQETREFGILLGQLANEGRAVLMVEHDMDLVMSACHYVYVLEFGRVIATGTPAEIRADRAVQAAYLGFVDDSEAASQTTRALNDVAALSDTALQGDTAVFGGMAATETTLEMPAVQVEPR